MSSVMGSLYFFMIMFNLVGIIFKIELVSGTISKLPVIIFQDNYFSLLLARFVTVPATILHATQERCLRYALI
jgi:hypothetical protein